VLLGFQLQFRSWGFAVGLSVFGCGFVVGVSWFCSFDSWDLAVGFSVVVFLLGFCSWVFLGLQQEGNMNSKNLKSHQDKEEKNKECKDIRNLDSHCTKL
jgi:hypothetical protein